MYDPGPGLGTENEQQLIVLCEYYLFLLEVFSCVGLFMTPWTVALQAPLSLEISRQEYWSGLPFPFPEDLPTLRIESVSHKSLALMGGFFTIDPPYPALLFVQFCQI